MDGSFVLELKKVIFNETLLAFQVSLSMLRRLRKLNPWPLRLHTCQILLEPAMHKRKKKNIDSYIKFLAIGHFMTENGIDVLSNTAKKKPYIHRMCFTMSWNSF